MRDQFERLNRRLNQLQNLFIRINESIVTIINKINLLTMQQQQQSLNSISRKNNFNTRKSLFDYLTISSKVLQLINISNKKKVSKVKYKLF